MNSNTDFEQEFEKTEFMCPAGTPGPKGSSFSEMVALKKMTNKDNSKTCGNLCILI